MTTYSVVSEKQSNETPPRTITYVAASGLNFPQARNKAGELRFQGKPAVVVPEHRDDTTVDLHG